MKIKYEFVNGETMEVEVEERIGTLILDSRRAEESNSRKERRHCYSSDCAWDGLEYATIDDVESRIIQETKNQKITNVLKKLTRTQRRRLLMSANGMSLREIARKEGICHRAVEKSIEQARKN